MNRHERRAQAATGEPKIIACRIRARRGSPCFFCDIADALEPNPQAALALMYFAGHQDEAAMRGPSLCDSCIALLEETTKRFAASNGGATFDMNAPGAGKS